MRSGRKSATPSVGLAEGLETLEARDAVRENRGRGVELEGTDVDEPAVLEDRSPASSPSATNSRPAGSYVNPDLVDWGFACSEDETAAPRFTSTSASIRFDGREVAHDAPAFGQAADDEDEAPMGSVPIAQEPPGAPSNDRVRVDRREVEILESELTEFLWSVVRLAVVLLQLLEAAGAAFAGNEHDMFVLAVSREESVKIMSVPCGDLRVQEGTGLRVTFCSRRGDRRDGGRLGARNQQGRGHCRGRQKS